MFNIEHICDDELALERLSHEFSQHLKLGDVCLLLGEIGAGKTFFTIKIYEHLGGNPDLAGSPSFTIVNHYPLADKDFYHVDLYRLDGVVEEDSIDQEEWMTPNGYSFIEWAERMEDWKPSSGFILNFRYHGEGRAVKIKAI